MDIDAMLCEWMLLMGLAQGEEEKRIQISHTVLLILP